MMNSTIPTEAIDAAMKAIESRMDGPIRLHDLARAALEAAAPYLTKRPEAIEASPILHIGMKAYIWVEAFGMWQDGTWDGSVWRVADNDTVENRFVSKWLLQ